MTIPLPCQRDSFKIPRDVAYLNCAYMSPLSNAVVAAGEEGIALKATPWVVTARDFFTRTDRVRGKASSLLGGTADNYAIIPSVSYGIATAIRNLPINKGEEIIVLEDQFPSNVYPWRVAASETGASVVTVRRADARSANAGTDWTPAILDKIRDHTTIVALPHCHWTDGSLIDLSTVSRRCKSNGTALVLDLTQSAGALPVNLADIDPDFAAIGGYKWMTGPYSLGLMYVADRHHGGRALEENWIVRGGAEDFSRLVDYRDDYEPGARRFDMGERSNFHLMPMLEAAIDQLSGWTVDRIAATLLERTGAITAQAAELGFSAEHESMRAGHFLGLRSEQPLPDDLVAQLAAHNVFVSVRGTSIRVTPHVYNDDEDTERFFSTLKYTL